MKSSVARLCLFAVFASLALNGCQPSKPVVPVVAPPPPPPPPPPPKPYPPLGASPNLVLPPPGVNGSYAQINAGNTFSQSTWNFRSAYNVAALNCLQPRHAQIVVNYRAFLKKHARGLNAANRGVDADFRKRFAAGYVREREAHMTRVYNFYAFPPTVPNFCDAALVVSNEGDAITRAQLGFFAAGALPRLDAIFEDFYRSYAQYRTELAAWNARYGPIALPPQVQPQFPAQLPAQVPAQSPAPSQPPLQLPPQLTAPSQPASLPARAQ